MTNWQPRLLRPGEEPALLDLLVDSFGSWPGVEIEGGPLDHLHWKLSTGLDGIRAAVIEHEGSFVAALILAFRQFSLKGWTILARTGWDAVVAPKYQGQGILSAAAPYYNALNASKADLMWGYRTGHAAARQAFTRTNLSIFGNFGNVLVASTGELKPARSQDPPWVLHVQPNFDERFDALWRDGAAQFDLFPSGRRPSSVGVIRTYVLGRSRASPPSRIGKSSGTLSSVYRMARAILPISSLARIDLTSSARSRVRHSPIYSKTASMKSNACCHPTTSISTSLLPSASQG